MRIIDAHHHFWRIGAPGHGWPDADWPRIHRDFTRPNLDAAIAELAPDHAWLGGVLVQSQPDDRDTDWMLEVAAQDAATLAVVGWVDFLHPDAPTRIARLATHAKLRGLRPMLQGIARTDWILQDAATPAIAAMVEHGLSFDALIEPRHLPIINRFARRWPMLPIVIDHAAKPAIVRGELDPWRRDLETLATLPNIWCKLSGLRTEQVPGQPASALRPYVDHLVGCFPDRLMWGSDWPVILHVGDSYRDWLDDTLALLPDATPDRLSDIFEHAARRFYKIDV